MKLERDNSLSCSLELTTLVIPWEIFYVLRIKFVSLPASHVHTFTPSVMPFVFSVHLSACPYFVHLLFSFSFSFAFELTFSPCVSSHCLCLYIFLPTFWSFSLSSISLRKLLAGPVSPSIPQLAGLID